MATEYRAMRYLRTPQKNHTFYVPGLPFNKSLYSKYAKLHLVGQPELNRTAQ